MDKEVERQRLYKLWNKLQKSDDPVNEFIEQILETREPLRKLSHEEVSYALAQAYCTEENKGKEMDAGLLTDMVDIIISRFGTEAGKDKA